MPAPLAIGALLTQGLRNEFANVYQPRYAGVQAQIGEVIWIDATSDKISELYGFLNAPIYPVRWDAGTMMPSKSILSTQFRITNRDFGRRVYLPRNWEDDQTGTAFQVARNLGANWGSLVERIFYQYMTNATDNDLLPVVPSSADGSALYIATTRYGVSGGNTVTQTGSATAQQIITDLFSMHARYYDFQNTESQPFWDPSDINRGISLFYGTSINLVMQQAAKAMVVALAASTATSNAGITNTVIASGVPFSWTMSQRITNTAIYGFLKGLPNDVRPMVRQVRKGMTEQQGNWETSDHTRDTGEPYVQFHSREGWGSALAIATVKIV